MSTIYYPYGARTVDVFPASFERLHELPPEVISNILSSVELETVNVLKVIVGGKSKYHNVKRECERTLCVRQYLEHNFGRGAEILRALSVCKAYIIGSYAAGFFVTNSAELPDCLTILVPHLTTMGLAMRLLHDLGVQWVSAESSIRECAAAGKGNVTVSKSSYIALIRSGAIERIGDEFGLSWEYWSNDVVSEGYLISVESSIIKVVPTKDYETVSDIANGQITHKTRTIRVKLVLQNVVNIYMSGSGLNTYISTGGLSVIGPHASMCYRGNLPLTVKYTYASPLFYLLRLERDQWWYQNKRHRIVLATGAKDYKKVLTKIVLSNTAYESSDLASAMPRDIKCDHEYLNRYQVASVRIDKEGEKILRHLP